MIRLVPLCLSADIYGELIFQLALWADQFCCGKIALFLEGGYDKPAGTACSLAAVSALLGEAWSDPLGRSPTPESDQWKEMHKQALKIGIPQKNINRVLDR